MGGLRPPNLPAFPEGFAFQTPGLNCAEHETFPRVSVSKMVYSSRVFNSENSIHFQGSPENSIHFHGCQSWKLYTLPWFSVVKIVYTSRVFRPENNIHFQVLERCPENSTEYTSRSLGLQSRKHHTLPDASLFSPENSILFQGVEFSVRKIVYTSRVVSP